MSPMKQQKFLDDLTFLNSLGKEPEDEVCEILDFVQSSPEEKQALADFVDYSWAMKDTDEWCWLTDDLLFGTHEEDHDAFYLKSLDHAEMSMDMISFEEEEACHELFAKQHFDERSGIGYHELNKRSEISLDGYITTVGDDYATMDTIYGKVFIPKYLLDHGHYCDQMEEHDSLQVRAQFKGFESARQTSMPWRAVFIEKNYGDEESQDMLSMPLSKLPKDL
jgi:hypothetical protein